jgi:hypothetical protein
MKFNHREKLRERRRTGVGKSKRNGWQGEVGNRGNMPTELSCAKTARRPRESLLYLPSFGLINATELAI